MKFRVGMKCPDAMYEAVANAVREEVNELGLPDIERDELFELRCKKIQELCVRKWFMYGEYLSVIVDTDAETCTVVAR